MAKGVYIGDSTSKARKVKKMHYGVGNLARTVKKGYIGIGGVARPFWTSGPGQLTYYGTITPLSIARQDASGATAGNYAMIAGGYRPSSYNNYYYSAVDTYNASLVMSAATNLTYATGYVIPATFKEYGVFANSSAGYDSNNIMNVYDSSLTQKSYSPLSIFRSRFSSGVIGDYLLFAGGNNKDQDGLSTVDAFDPSFTRTTAQSLSVARGMMGASGKTGDYVIFGSGISGAIIGGARNNVDAYNHSLTRVTATSFSENIAYAGAASAGDYTIFSCDSKAYYAYDPSLTRINMPDHGTAVGMLDRSSSGSVETYALMGGGGDYYSAISDITVYDSSLTLLPDMNLSIARYGVGVASIKNFLLFAGGNLSNKSNNVTNIVDVFTTI